ncbi:MAG: thioredoxin [Aestuariivita sp.]|nr:thioredoxin [Aestuariivita sp.]
MTLARSITLCNATLCLPEPFTLKPCKTGCIPTPNSSHTGPYQHRFVSIDELDGFSNRKYINRGSHQHYHKRIKVMSTISVTDETFEQEVKNSDIPVVVDFWAEWCGPCKQIGPTLEDLAVEMSGKIKIAKVNVDENQNSPAQMGVRGIPALFIFKDGEVISNRSGAASYSVLKNWIETSI